MADKKKKETPEEKANREMIEGMAENISILSRSVKALLNGKLKRVAIVHLLVRSSRLSHAQVEEMLKAIENLEKNYVN